MEGTTLKGPLHAYKLVVLLSTTPTKIKIEVISIRGIPRLHIIVFSFQFKVQNGPTAKCRSVTI